MLLLFINTDLFCRTRFSFSSFKIFFTYFHRAIQPTYPVESYVSSLLLLSCKNHDILHAKCHTFWANRDSTNYSFHTTKNLGHLRCYDAYNLTKWNAIIKVKQKRKENERKEDEEKQYSMPCRGMPCHYLVLVNCTLCALHFVSVGMFNKCAQQFVFNLSRNIFVQSIAGKGAKEFQQ